MIEVEANQLKRAVENQHGSTATFIQTVPVKETFDSKTVGDGIVHVFKIDGHPQARKAYAWSSPIEGAISGGTLRCCIYHRLHRQWMQCGRLSWQERGPS